MQTASVDAVADFICEKVRARCVALGFVQYPRAPADGRVVRRLVPLALTKRAMTPVPDFGPAAAIAATLVPRDFDPKAVPLLWQSVYARLAAPTTSIPDPSLPRHCVACLKPVFASADEGAVIDTTAFDHVSMPSSTMFLLETRLDEIEIHRLRDVAPTQPQMLCGGCLANLAAPPVGRPRTTIERSETLSGSSLAGSDKLDDDDDDNESEELAPPSVGSSPSMERGATDLVAIADLPGMAPPLDRSIDDEDSSCGLVLDDPDETATTASDSARLPTAVEVEEDSVDDDDDSHDDLCCVCSAVRGGVGLMCEADGCTRTIHPECIGLGVDEVPEGEFFCPFHGGCAESMPHRGRCGACGESSTPLAYDLAARRWSDRCTSCVRDEAPRGRKRRAVATRTPPPLKSPRVAPDLVRIYQDLRCWPVDGSRVQRDMFLKVLDRFLRDTHSNRLLLRVTFSHVNDDGSAATRSIIFRRVDVDGIGIVRSSFRTSARETLYRDLPCIRPALHRAVQQFHERIARRREVEAVREAADESSAEADAADLAPQFDCYVSLWSTTTVE